MEITESNTEMKPSSGSKEQNRNGRVWSKLIKPSQNTKEKEKDLKMLREYYRYMKSKEVRTEILISDLEILQKKKTEQRIDRSNKDITEEKFQNKRPSMQL